MIKDSSHNDFVNRTSVPLALLFLLTGLLSCISAQTAPGIFNSSSTVVSTLPYQFDGYFTTTDGSWTNAPSCAANSQSQYNGTIALRFPTATNVWVSSCYYNYGALFKQIMPDGTCRNPEQISRYGYGPSCRYMYVQVEANIDTFIFFSTQLYRDVSINISSTVPYMCDAAHHVRAVPLLSHGVPVFESISPSDPVSNAYQCLLNEYKRGKWYRISGLSGTIYASTCGSTSFNSSLHVLTAEPFCQGCDCMRCVGWNMRRVIPSVNINRRTSYEYECADPRHSVVKFTANSSKEYYVFVTGATSEHYGDFALIVTSEAFRVTNIRPVPALAPEVIAANMTGAIVGGTVGGVVFLALVGALIGVLIFKRMNSNIERNNSSAHGATAMPANSPAYVPTGGSWTAPPGTAGTPSYNVNEPH